jgi:predicted nucleotidyltransferase
MAVVMEDETSNTNASEPPAAYWNAEDLPSMPRFLRELIDQAKSRLQVSKIMVFGSRARVDCSPTSDYDLAFILEDLQGWAHFVADQQEEAGTLLPLDLVNFHEASEELRKDILASGVTLYEK